MCDQKDPEPNPFDPDEEPTQPAPRKTTREIAEEWRQELSVPPSERPTKKLRKLTLP